MNQWLKLLLVVLALWGVRAYSVNRLETGREDERVRLKRVLDDDGPTALINEVRKGWDRPDLREYDFADWRRVEREYHGP
jgi:hypothetical protein